MADSNPLVVVENENQAWAILSQLIDGSATVPEKGVPVHFKNWDPIKIYIPHSSVESSITPSMMKGFIEIQKAVYSAYTLGKYGEDNLRRLTDYERDRLEIVIVVKGGSFDHSIDVQNILQTLAVELVGKMSSTELMILVLGVATLFFGQSAWRSYLDTRKDERLKRIDLEAERARLEATKFASEEETKRMALIKPASEQAPLLNTIREVSEIVHKSLLNNAVQARGATVNGVTIEEQMAIDLSVNPRRQGDDLIISGSFKILKVDTTTADGFTVNLQKMDTQEIFQAGVREVLLSADHIEKIQKAEWSKKPISANIEAHRVGGKIVKAMIRSVD